MKRTKQKQQLDLFESGTGDASRKKADNLSMDINAHLSQSDIAGAKLAINEQEAILKKFIEEKRKNQSKNKNAGKN